MTTKALPENRCSNPGSPAAVSAARLCSQEQCLTMSQPRVWLQPGLALPGTQTAHKPGVNHYHVLLDVLKTVIHTVIVPPCIVMNSQYAL